MPRNVHPERDVHPHAFAPRALRTDPAERRRLEALIARTLARHPAWPWPLIEAEARRALLAARPVATEEDCAIALHPPPHPAAPA